MENDRIHLRIDFQAIKQLIFEKKIKTGDGV